MIVTRTITLEELPGLIQQVPSDLQRSADIALMLPRIVDAARAFCPVKTGALRDSIRVERPSSITAILMAGGGSIDYAGHVHDGTIDTPARPFLEQAIISGKPVVGKEILGGALP